MVQVIIPRPSGHGKVWAKHITNFNNGARGGFAFDGKFLNINGGSVELPDDAIICVFSQKPQPTAHLYQLVDGSFKQLASVTGIHWADQLRPHVANVVPTGTASTARPIKASPAPIPMPGLPGQANVSAEFNALKVAVGMLFHDAGVTANDVINDDSRPQAHRHLAAVYEAIMSGRELPVAA